MRSRSLLLLLAVAVIAVSLSLARSAAPPTPVPPVDFSRDVQPILAARCLKCHNATRQKGGLRLDDPAAARRSGVILPGRSGESPLLRRVLSTDEDFRMPPTGAPLNPAQVAMLRAWIDQGAVGPPAGSTGPVHWAYRPLVRPAVPPVQQPDQVRNPIDAFVLARLEARGLAPSPEADRRTLLRRLSYDLTGLPPTPEEVRVFLEDRTPDAWEKMVDRLLASPAYGERWARHWLDVVHYAETHGHDQDVPRENAWPYRDYLIRAFNDDRPYARFVEEQVAGDVLQPESPDGIAALGMLAAGPWDESSQQSIRDDTLDKKVAQTLDRDDMLTTVFSAFSSTTIHCARCHDHKFDPILQSEYYGLQAVFAGIDRANRPWDADSVVHQRRQNLTGRLADSSTTPLADLLTPENRARLTTWEKERGSRAEGWTILTPSRIQTANGSLPTQLPDQSIRFGGPRPEKEITTIEAVVDASHLTAVRLEVLTDDSLPHKGPGRQENGNLHLNEFRVHVAPVEKPTERRPIPLQRATADFDQQGWTAAMAIDGNPATAWGIHPAVGRPHQVVFEFAAPLTQPGKTTLAFTLEQTHGGHHLIGRLRLAVTSAKEPLRLAPLSPALASHLAVPPDKRTAQQTGELIRFIRRSDLEAELAALPPPGQVFVGTHEFKPEGSFRPAQSSTGKARGCRPVHLLRRGDIQQPLTLAEPAALSCVSGLPGKLTLARPDDEGVRRAALARWLSDSRNALTWRSIVNRVWHHHFGRGIASTPGDLGHMGSPPTHPELLDWLASTFRDGGGSLKQLHRLIVTSSTYRQSSAHRADHARVDADNSLLWRMNRTRLDAESVRDAVLVVSGQIERTMGGPSVKHFVQSKGIHVTPKVEYDRFNLDAPGAGRRSIYRFVFRTLPDPFLDALDCPDASQFTPARSASVTPLQALALLNDRFMVRQSEHWAARLRSSHPEPGDQVEQAFFQAFSRPPTERERTLLSEHARRYGLANVCRLLLNSNEFLFID